MHIATTRLSLLNVDQQNLQKRSKLAGIAAATVNTSAVHPKFLADFEATAIGQPRPAMAARQLTPGLAPATGHAQDVASKYERAKGMLREQIASNQALRAALGEEQQQRRVLADGLEAERRSKEAALRRVAELVCVPELCGRLRRSRIAQSCFSR